MRMTTWNYRRMKISYELPAGKSEDQFAIHEVHYGDDGKPHSYTANPVVPQGVDLEDFRCDFKNFLQAARAEPSEVLTSASFPWYDG